MSRMSRKKNNVKICFLSVIYMYYDKKSYDLIMNIIKVSIFLLIIAMAIFAFKTGFNKVFIKVKKKTNDTKNIINDRLTEDNLKYTLNENLFDFLLKIKTFFEKPNFFVLLFSFLIFIVWFYIFYTITQSYFYDSEVLYKDVDDKYNKKHLFDSIYSDYDKQMWTNSNENNYISKTGKLCRLSTDLFNSCLAQMNSEAKEEIFSKNFITPDFINVTREMLLKERYDRKKNIFIRKCELNIGEPENGRIETQKCKYIPVNIDEILYNKRTIKISNYIENDSGTHDTRLMSFDDIKIIFPLENGFYFDIRLKDLNNLYKTRDDNNRTKDSSDNLFIKQDNGIETFWYLNDLSYNKLKKEENILQQRKDISNNILRFIVDSPETFIKCKIINIETSYDDGNLSKLDLIVYNPDEDTKGSRYEKYIIKTNTNCNISGVQYMGNYNTAAKSSENSKTSIINKFNVIPYLGENFKLKREQFEEKRKIQSVNDNDDLSNVLDKDISENPILESLKTCIVYTSSGDLIKGDIVKIISRNEDYTEENSKLYKYNVKKYNNKETHYDENEMIIGRNYLLCSDIRESSLVSDILFNNKCLQQQENMILKYNPENEYYNCGCK